jgi:glycosyltransferase involved in cell wall biosynthesis
MLDAVLALPNKQFSTVICYTTDLWHNYLEQRNIPAIKISRTYFSRAWFQLRYPLGFWRTISRYADSFTRSFLEQNCDLWIFPSQDIWPYSLPIQSLSTVHDLMHRYERNFPEAGSDNEYKAREIHYSRTCKYSLGILVDSHLGKKQLVESYKADQSKIHVLPFVPPNYIYDESDSNIDIDLPDKFIFYPAQFWEHKNHKGIVEAVNLIVDKIPDLKFVFVGSPNNGYDKILKFINKYSLRDIFIFRDHIPDEQMRFIYKKARALVMPTFFGPTNIPPLEAFATGCPVAVSNVYAMPEQVGDAGLLFNPSSKTEIADTIYNLWVDDELVRNLSEKGKKRDNAWNQRHFNSRLEEFIKIALT